MIDRYAGRPNRDPIYIHPEVRTALRMLLLNDAELQGIGYSEFIMRAIESARKENEMTQPTVYDRPAYAQFVEDMDAAGIEWKHYGGRYFYQGPAVRTDENGWPTMQDVIRATSVEVQWDNMGRDFIVYPR